MIARVRVAARPGGVLGIDERPSRDRRAAEAMDSVVKVHRNRHCRDLRGYGIGPDGRSATGETLSMSRGLLTGAPMRRGEAAEWARAIDANARMTPRRS